MKRFAMLIMLAMVFAPALMAQDLDHAELGVFVNYTRLHNAGDANFYGIGGRAGFNVHPNVQLEGEIAYDFEKNADTDFSSNGVRIGKSGLRMIHGLFGPKLQVGTGAFRLFGTVKGGFVNFSTTKRFANQISQFGSGDTNGVLYPGGGVEVFAGPIGLRVEIGDEIYWDRGANHNVRATAGPVIRF